MAAEDVGRSCAAPSSASRSSVPAKTRPPKLELTNAIFEYLQILHNRQRRHSALGWRTPVEFEKLHATDVA